MKLILTILTIVIYSFVNRPIQLLSGNVYHIKNGGNDALDGLTDATAWEHLSKIKSGSFSAGDSILLKRGDTFNDSIRVNTAGINIGAYGTGDKPVVTGFRLMTLTSEGGNIYSGYSSGLVKDLNCVLINGQIGYKARYPNIDSTNGGFLTATSATYFTVVTAFSMPSSFSGDEIIVRTAHYIYDKSKVNNQSGSTINIRDPLTYNGFQFGANGFFFQNDSAFLDRVQEFYHDSTNNRFKVYSTTTPTVYESIIDTLIKVSANNVSISNITATGANRIAFLFDSSYNNISATNCSINNIGKRGFSNRGGKRFTIQNDSVQNVLSDGAYLWSQFDSSIIDNNYFKNIGMFAGMGQYTYGNANLENLAMIIAGDSNNITNNRFDSIGYIGFYWVGHNTNIYRNYGTNFCAIKDDGGGIYTNLSPWPAGKNKGSRIRSNIMVNGIGLDAGSAGGSFAAGIYFDAGTKGVEVDSSLSLNGHNAVLYLLGADSNNINDNLFVNNLGNVFQYAVFTGFTNTSGNIFKRNIYYTNGSDAYTRALINFLSVSNVGNSDSNYYSKPTDETYPFTLSGNPYTWAQFLAGFNSHDTHSSQTPINPSYFSPKVQSVIYNPTLADSTVDLGANTRWADVKGNYYYNSIVLHPFQSALLYKVYNNITGTISNTKYKIFR